MKPIVFELPDSNKPPWSFYLRVPGVILPTTMLLILIWSMMETWLALLASVVLFSLVYDVCWTLIVAGRTFRQTEQLQAEQAKLLSEQGERLRKLEEEIASIKGNLTLTS